MISNRPRRVFQFLRPLILVGLLLCGATLLTVVAQESGEENAESKPAAASSQPLKPRDQVKLTVFGEDSLTTTETINSAGMVSFPLIGDIKAEGQTASEIALKVEQLLEKDYIRDANVTIAVVEFQEPERPVVTTDRGPKKIGVITVGGEVRAPGTVEMFEDQPMDLLKAIYSVGGFTPVANQRKVTVKRASGNVEDVNAAELQDNSEVYLLRPGDIVTVKKRVF